MPTLNGILEIGKRGLTASQVGTNTAGQNISNVNTPGYSRQRTVLRPDEISDTLLGSLGAGVDVQQISRQRDIYLDRQLRTASASLGRFRAESEHLGAIEDILQEPGGEGLGGLLDAFWSAWYDVSNAPEDRGVRQALVTRSTALIDGFHRISRGLAEARDRVKQETIDTIAMLNASFSELARLNGEITKAQGQVSSANAALDRRDQILDEISALVPVDVVYNSAGSVNVYVDGHAVVQGVQAGQFNVDVTSSEGEEILQLTGVDGNTLRLRNGELKALIDVRDTILASFQRSLDEVAESLVSAVNDLHEQGYSSDGHQGLSFFDSTNTRAKDIALDPVILADVSNVAVSRDGTPGDNSVALEIARLRTDPIMSNGTTTLGGRYREMVTELGSRAQAAAQSQEGQQLVVGHLTDSRESVQGVNLDEEMASLITFQNAYSAAARIITTVDEMMQTLLTM